MKTPEEIKKGMECAIWIRGGECGDSRDACRTCPLGDACYDACYDPVENAIDSLTYIQQLEAARQKWISIDEKHPDAGEWVLTYCGGYAKWFDLNKWCGNCWLKTMPVTHWMPLPEPPKEDA